MWRSFDDGGGGPEFGELPLDSHVTEVTRKGAQRRHYARPTATEAQNNRRLALGAQWREIIDAGLAALENQRNGGAHE